jgi:ABC-type uncharacterized transport system involved in gliding motility auxiliary subunit
MADELEPTPAPGGPEEPAPGPPDEETPRGRRRRRWRRSVEETVLRGSLLGAGVFLVLALLAIVSYLGWKYHWRWDWTETRIYSLSETTENVLAELDEDVRVTVFITPGSRLYEPVRELLARYEAASPRLSVRWLDPERNPVEARRLVEEYQVSAESVVFEAGGERRAVSADDLAELDFSMAQLGQEPEISAFQGEERFTSALVALAQGEKPAVLFTTGHGELSLDDASATGLQAARDLLGPDNVEIDEWASLGAEAVPEGTDLVVVAGPQAAFTADELAVLGRFLAAGGRLLALLDPAFQAGGPASGMADLGLQAWLADYGVRVGDDLVVDPSTAPLGFSAETFFATRYGSHAVTRSLADGGIPVLVRHARSVAAGTAPEGATVVELVETGPDGWAVTSFDRESYGEPAAGDPRGPIALAVAVEAERSAEAGGEAAEDGTGDEAEAEPSSAGMRLAVVGDSDFATSAFLQMGPGNQILLSSLFNWLIEREALVGIPPKRPEQVRLSMTPAELGWAVALVVLVLPGLAVALGVWVWLRRRRVR